MLSDDKRKKEIAKTILKSRPIISVQVVSENINVLTKKFKHLSLEEVWQHARLLQAFWHTSSMTVSTIEKALEIKNRYGSQWYDSTILSSAILNNCNVLYSEDMQHNMLIEESLRIINPFL